jgi:hypothetical protein
MAQVTFRHGNPTHIDYTPTGGNVNAGDVVSLGNTSGLSCGIASVAIENNVKGAVAIGGVWEGINLNNAADYTYVYWDGTKFTTTSTNNERFGFIVRDGAGGANTNCLALHAPQVFP